MLPHRCKLSSDWDKTTIMGLTAQHVVDAYLAMKYVGGRQEAPLEFSAFLNGMVHIEPGSLNQSPITMGNAMLLANGAAGVRRSPRTDRCELVESKYMPAIRNGPQTARDHRQAWCGMCRMYKVQHMCKVHQVYLCRPGIMGKRDRSARTCYEDHIKYGLPAGRGKYKIGPWCIEYDDLLSHQRAWPAAKRRASGGMLIGTYATGTV